MLKPYIIRKLHCLVFRYRQLGLSYVVMHKVKTFKNNKKNHRMSWYIVTTQHQQLTSYIQCVFLYIKISVYLGSVTVTFTFVYNIKELTAVPFIITIFTVHTTITAPGENNTLSTFTPDVPVRTRFVHAVYL